MATSVESEESKAAKIEAWKRNTWSAIQVTYVISYSLNLDASTNSIHVSKIITSSPEMINIINKTPDDDGNTFHASVHKELVCYYSQYYTAALKGGFSEAKKDTIIIELHHDLITDLVSWLYTGRLTSESDDELMDLYVFADEKMMLAFRRSIMSRLIQTQDPVFEFHIEAADALPYLTRLPQNSGLFRYLIDYWAVVWSTTDSNSEMEILDRERRIPRIFFYKVLEALGFMLQVSGTPKAYIRSGCNYHEHVNFDEWLESTLPSCSDLLIHVLLLTIVACGSESPKRNRPTDEYYVEQ
jgi:hypothetical protein